MSATLEIPADAAGRIDVFALDLPVQKVDSFVTPTYKTDNPQAAWPLRTALDADYLDPAGVEAIRLGDLEGLGLAGYLTEGLGVDDKDIKAIRGDLEALAGQVVILRGKAHGGMAQTLRPRPPLRHVATLHEAATPPPRPALRSNSAKLETPVRDAEDTSGAEDAGTGSPLPLVFGGLILAAILVAGLTVFLT